jgi:hypothetical protein
MTSHMGNLFSTVDGITRGDEIFLSEVVTNWRGSSRDSAIRERIREWLMCSADLNVVKTLARETSTHYVWPLYRSVRGYSVTINEFKDPLDISDGYATTLHNHRYSFVSLVLSGGYTQVFCDVELRDQRQASRVRDLYAATVTEGDVVAVQLDEFHCLSSISQGTVTLVVKCPPARGESISINTSNLRVSRHIPVEGRVGQLMAGLLAVSTRGR